MDNCDLIEVYIRRFVNRADVWSAQWLDTRQNPPKAQYAQQKPGMKFVGGRAYEPVTPDLVRRHIAGAVTCAWAATDHEQKGKWLCFDSDDNTGSLDRLDGGLRYWGLHVLREGGRPGRQGHLWLNFDQPIPATKLIALGDTMMRLCGVTGLERFPKSATGYSQVRGPLGVNLKPEALGARGWFDGVARDVTQQLQWLAEQPLNSSEDAIREADRHGNLRIESPRPYRTNLRRYERTSILDLVEHKRAGSGYVAQCPVCAAEGHDNHRDNLQISADGTDFYCVYGGPHQVHKVVEIKRALLVSIKQC